MKKLLLTFLPFLLILLLLSGCKKDKKSPTPQYTISGTILMAYDDQVPPPKWGWSVTVVEEEGWPIGIKSDLLGYFSPNDSGYFTFSYKSSKIDGPNAEIVLESDPPSYIQIRNLPVNQNVKNDTFYTRPPEYGLLKLSLSPKSDYPNDTLFLGITKIINFKPLYFIDTIVDHKDTTFPILRVPTPYTNIDWGLDRKNFQYDPINKVFHNRQNDLYVKIKGIPKIDTATLHY